MKARRIRPSCWLVLSLACLRASHAEDGSAVRLQGGNLARGKTVQFNTPPNYPAVTDPDDGEQLVDGLFSSKSPIWYDKNTAGWVLVDPTVFTIDLGEVHPIRGVALHMGAGRAGVEWPSSIQVYVSDSGKRYSHLGDLMQLLVQQPPAEGYASFWLVTDKLETHGRFVKFVCSPTNLGNGAHIMLDEVEVYRGEAAWLNRPLAWPEAPERWRADWSQIQWRADIGAISEVERPTRIVLIDGETEQGAGAPLQQAVAGTDGVSFTLNGEAGRPRRMHWTGSLAKPISTANCRYALLTFRAEGIRRTHDVLPLVALQGVNDQAGDNRVTLLEVNMAMNDGLSHTLVRRLPESFTFHQIKVALFTESDAPCLTLERLELLRVATPGSGIHSSLFVCVQPVGLVGGLNRADTWQAWIG